MTANQSPRTAWTHSRLAYYRHLASWYLLGRGGHLGFWHDTPVVAAPVDTGRLGPYLMVFAEKSDYAGPFDSAGIPLLDYGGEIGPQHNPIAISQYALGNYNRWAADGSDDRKRKFLVCADWLVDNLEVAQGDLLAWQHHFDWRYRQILRAPWHSGLAQGQGISVLVRAHAMTEEEGYRECAEEAMRSLMAPVSEGGTLWTWEDEGVWVEEYLVDPPTHILNGHVWALWGVWDFALATGDEAAKRLFDTAIITLKQRLADYDTGYWSLYELSGTKLPMLASPFYHRLHIAQLRGLHRITGDAVFDEYADRWASYQRSRAKRTWAFVGKALFKVFHY